MDYDRQDFAPCNTLHFGPDGALVGDVSFFSRDGACHLFYLTKRNDDPPRLPHNQLDHAVSTDLLHWERLPPALLPGEPGTADANRHRRLHHRAGPGRVPHVLRRHGQRGNTSGATPAITSGSSRA